MLKEFAWMAFENTGNIDSYMFYREMEDKFNLLNEGKIAEEEAATSK